MSAEPNYDQDMRLPDGKTCGDCAHSYRCTIFGFTPSLENARCDFWPSRFRLKVTARGDADESKATP
jgi:hypothetical protein